MLIILVKILLTPFALLEIYCKAFVALMMWDKKPFEEDLFSYLWDRD